MLSLTLPKVYYYRVAVIHVVKIQLPVFLLQRRDTGHELCLCISAVASYERHADTRCAESMSKLYECVCVCVVNKLPRNSGNKLRALYVHQWVIVHVCLTVSHRVSGCMCVHMILSVCVCVCVCVFQ